jgi:hypothetical protein
MYKIEPISPAHAAYVANRLRSVDRAECEATHGSVDAAIEDSIKRSHICWTWLIDGEPAVIGGVCIESVAGAIGLPWMLTTPAIENHKIAFARMTKRFHEAVTRELGLELLAFIDVRDKSYLNWVKWLGMKIDEPFVHNGVTFSMVH